MNYLIYGTSYKLIEEELEKIVGSKKTEIYDLEESSLEEVIKEFSYQSLFEDTKILIIKSFSKINSFKKDNKEYKSLLEYLENPNPNIIIISISNEKISSRGAIKDLLDHLQIIETPIITKSYELVKILENLFRKDGYFINPNALNIFAEKCANNYDIAINEYEKLKSIKGSNKNITEEDINEYVSNYNMNDIFAFKDCVLNKDIKNSMRMIDELEYSKMELIPIVVMLAKEYSTLYDVKILSDKKLTNEAIGTTLNKMHPYRVKLLRSTSTKYTFSELERIIVLLCDLDKKLISEDNLGFDELRKFVISI